MLFTFSNNDKNNTKNVYKALITVEKAQFEFARRTAFKSHIELEVVWLPTQKGRGAIFFVVFQCEPIPNNGFKRGSYRCTCKPGFYFPDINANLKAFNGSIIEEEYDKKMKGLQTDYNDKFHCIPCSEGCEECTDGSPCIYKEQIIPRIVLISVNGLAAMMAVMIGVMVFYFRDSKVSNSCSVRSFLNSDGRSRYFSDIS